MSNGARPVRSAQIGAANGERGSAPFRYSRAMSKIPAFCTVGSAAAFVAIVSPIASREGAKLVIAEVLEHEGRQVADAIGASARFEPLEVTIEEGWAAGVSSGSHVTRRWRETDSNPRSPGGDSIFARPPRSPATTNRPGSQNGILTIDKGRFTMRRARLAPE